MTTRTTLHRRPRTSGTTPTRTAFQCAVATLVSSTAQASNRAEPMTDEDHDALDADDQELAESFAEAMRAAGEQDAGVLHGPVEIPPSRRAA